MAQDSFAKVTEGKVFGRVFIVNFKALQSIRVKKVTESRKLKIILPYLIYHSPHARQFYLLLL